MKVNMANEIDGEIELLLHVTFHQLHESHPHVLDRVWNEVEYRL